MVLPRLIHKAQVVIERKNSSTIQDSDYEEPVQNVSRTTYTIPGQPRWGFDKSFRPTPGGAEEGSDGYVLFRRVDLQAAGIDDVERGDRIIKIGTGSNLRNVDLHVTSIRPEGHYTDQGGPALVKAYFKDRQPVYQNRGGL